MDSEKDFSCLIPMTMLLFSTLLEWFQECWSLEQNGEFDAWRLHDLFS